MQKKNMILGIFLVMTAMTWAQEKESKEIEMKKSELTPEQYYVCVQGGTERAFTGKYWDHKEKGTYVCAVCSSELFQSKTKYASGSGWPSFYKASGEGQVQTKRDVSQGMVRTEIVCAKCGSHLGHVFDDGPQPTGMRYCVNSASLDFVSTDTSDQKDKKDQKDQKESHTIESK